MRFHPTRGAMSLGKSKGGLPPDSCCEEEDAALEEMKRLVETYHDNSRSVMTDSGLLMLYNDEVQLLAFVN